MVVTEHIVIAKKTKAVLNEIKLCKDEMYQSVIVRLLKMHPDFPKFKDRLE